MNWVTYLRCFHAVVFQEYLTALEAAASMPYGQRFEAGLAVATKYARLACSLATSSHPDLGVSGG